jgi:beta-phosphoglucomutase-like phosphatase (HAD superfamily)
MIEKTGQTPGSTTAEYHIPGLGVFDENCGMRPLTETSDGHFSVKERRGACAASAIFATGDGKIETVSFPRHSLACVKSSLAYPAYYPIRPLGDGSRPVSAVLMDLDGTTVRSEEFWISIIEMTLRSLLGRPGFELEDADIPFVSGHSVSEHLRYCIDKYCPEQSLTAANEFYFSHTRREMDLILHHGKTGAFTPSPGVKDFLLFLKRRGLKIGLVTSGLYEKAWPEILSAFREMALGDPADFYDSIVTAGVRLGRGEAGTLGELEAKPHPWLYTESGVIGLGITAKDADGVIGIEDSGAGVCAVRLAGYRTIGLGGGNIRQSGTMAFVTHFCETFGEIEGQIRERDQER